MTIIVWDGKTLAADKQIDNGWIVGGLITKIHRCKDCLIGGSGESSIVNEMAAWFSRGPEPSDFPQSARDGQTHLMVITPQRQVLLYEGSPYPIQLENSHAAIGSGKQAALALLMVGCSSTKAVEIVSQLYVGCGGGIDTLTLD